MVARESDADAVLSSARRRRPRGASGGKIMLGRFLVVALLTLSAGEGLAQQQAYQFATPAGWRQSEADGAVVLTAPEGAGGGAMVLLSPVRPLGPDLAAQLARSQQDLEQSLGLRAPKLNAPQRGRSAAGERLMVGGSYLSDAGPRYLLLYALASEGVLGEALFVATSEPAYRRYAGEATALFNRLRLTGQAAQLAAANAARPPRPEAQPPPPPSPQAPDPAPTASAGGRGALANVGRPIAIGRDNKQAAAVTLADLVGVWVNDTIIRNDHVSAGYFNNSFGGQDWGIMLTLGTPMGSGGTYLKVRPSGAYEYWFDHVQNGCAKSYGHAGTASVQDGALVLRPAVAREQGGPVEEGNRCDRYDRKIAPEQRTYKVELGSYTTAHGYPTYRLRLQNAVQPSDYKVLDRVEARPLPDSAMPPGFVVGNAQAAGDLQGTWAAAQEGVAADEPGRYHATLRLLQGGRYELVVHRPNALVAPVCIKNLDLTEEGTARFQGRVEGSDNRQEGGTLVLQPVRSRLALEVLHCGADDVPRQVMELPAVPRYLRWTLRAQQPITAPPTPGDSLVLGCPRGGDPWSAWQFLACPEAAGQLYDGYKRR
jgi:hypothetical protein